VDDIGQGIAPHRALIANAFPLLLQIANRRFWMPWGYTNDGNPYFADIVIPDGTQWIALAPIGIGISHVIVYLVGKQKEGR
jgi:hypothetical protein